MRFPKQGGVVRGPDGAGVPPAGGPPVLHLRVRQAAEDDRQ